MFPAVFIKRKIFFFLFNSESNAIQEIKEETIKIPEKAFENDKSNNLETIY